MGKFPNGGGSLKAGRRAFCRFRLPEKQRRIIAKDGRRLGAVAPSFDLPAPAAKVCACAGLKLI